MKAVVLSGGYATRLRPISYALPKLLFPVAGKPMIYWTLDLLQKYGVDQVVLAVNYLSDSLRAAVRERYNHVRISYSLESKPLGTGGPIKLAADKLKLKETFIAMNGDIITEIALDEMLRHHQESGAIVTDALHEVRDPSRFGVVKLDSEGRIQSFVEKPNSGQAPSHLVNAGIYMIEPKLLSMIPSNRKVSLEREIFPILAKRAKLSGFPFKGKWFDIGNLSDYRKANFELLKRQATNASYKHRTSRIRQPVFLGERTHIGAGAIVGPKVALGVACVIRRGARVSDSILFDRVTVGERTIVTGAIIASNASLGKNVRIDRGAVVSPNVKVNDEVRIGSNAIIHPYKEIILDVPSGAHVM
jgi:NDP-sugar pyrophosphorylase family protein